MLNKILDLFRPKQAAPSSPDDLLFAIVAADNWTASFLDLPPDALRAYLDSQARHLNDTDATVLFAHESAGKTYIPVFTNYEGANAFGQSLYREAKRKDPRVGLMCLPLVQMDRSLVYDRIVTSGKSAILDPGTDNAREIPNDELHALHGKRVNRDIKKHLIVQKDKAAPTSASTP